ncbi:MAG TPA: hypothetical protein VFY93_03465 [Planctomycetota bacterium]|nr:hypothetical protein [Planctomycetota bacterium]
MLFWAVFLAGLALVAASLLLRPRRAGPGWSLDVGYSDRVTHTERVLFFLGVALVLLALVALR